MKFMKRILCLCLFLISLFIFVSCITSNTKWKDNIHLSVRSADFNSSGDSAIIKTEGSSWWISHISVDSVCFGTFPGIDLLSDKYLIIQDCFVIERRDKNTLFVRVDANPLHVKRIITIGFEAGDYFDRVTITQKSQ
jgi:hypothetical protein